MKHALFFFSLLFVCFSASANAKVQFSKLVIFGDSLSDTGNLAAVTLNFPYPFHANRVSDGPLLVDYLAAAYASSAAPSLHLDDRSEGFNFAVLGGNILGDDREDLSAQVDAYLSRVNNRADAQAMYFVLIGGNDLRDLRAQSSSAQALLRIDLIVRTLSVQLQRLIDAGATTLVVANVADIGRLPETLMRQAADPEISARATQYTRAYNESLQTELQQLRRSTVELVELDLFGAFNNLLANTSALGYRHTDVGCFELSGYSFHPDCESGRRFDRFVFFDNLHPSGKTNKFIADALIGELSLALVNVKPPAIVPAIKMLLLAD